MSPFVEHRTQVLIGAGLPLLGGRRGAQIARTGVTREARGGYHAAPES